MEQEKIEQIDEQFETIKYISKKIAQAVSDYEAVVHKKTAFIHINGYAYGRVIEQFAVALTWKYLHPDVQPPALSEHRERKE